MSILFSRQIRAAIAASMLCLSTCAVQALEEVKVTTTEYPPYTGEALPGGGVVTEIAREAFRRGGYAMQVRFLPWSRALRDAQMGQADGAISIWHSQEREQWFVFSKPLGENKIGLMVLAEKPIRYTTLSDLKPYRIGTVRNYANPPAFIAAKLNSIESKDDEVNLRALAARRLDAILIDKGVAHHILRDKLSDTKEKLIWLEPAVARMPLHVAISKTAPDSANKLAAFNLGLDAMQKDGTLAAMVKQAGIQ